MTRSRKTPLAAAALFLWAGACSSVDPATRLTRELLSMPKEEAYAKGDALVAKKKWELGRQYLRFTAENYANDPIGKQAALRLADSYFQEGTALGFLEAQARYKDFRSRYPSHPKADYALFRLAQCSDKQAEAPDRDQTNTRLAASSYRELLQLFPDSPYTAEARVRLTAMRELLAEHEFRVARYYMKRGAWSAAKGRYEGVLAAFTSFGRMDRVLYDSGVIEKKLGRAEEAAAFWERLRRDYPESAWAKKLPRGETAPAAPPTAGATAPAAGGV